MLYWGWRVRAFNVKPSRHSSSGGKIGPEFCTLKPIFNLLKSSSMKWIWRASLLSVWVGPERDHNTQTKTKREKTHKVPMDISQRCMWFCCHLIQIVFNTTFHDFPCALCIMFFFYGCFSIITMKLQWIRQAVWGDLFYNWQCIWRCSIRRQMLVQSLTWPMRQDDCCQQHTNLHPTAGLPL